jgi:Secretion system C-terminal sorting domain
MNNDCRIIKLVAFIALLLLPFNGIAQNYQCLQAGVKHYFTNSNGYLRGIRIDSTKSYTDSTVFYPYHTPRGRFYTTALLDSNGGSWLGKKVVALPDGTFLFYNMWDDTVIIKTQAHKGDVWHLYDDTTALYYQAEVLSEDTMTILGAVDSVKQILITARNTTGIVTSDLIDSLQLVISKNSGFVKAVDLYTFPYHAPDSIYSGGIDYYFDESHGVDFSLIPFHWPSTMEMYDWDIGDAYEYKYCETIFGGGCSYPQSFRYDSIVGKTIFPDSVIYQVAGWQIAQHWVGPYHVDRWYPYWKTDNSRTFSVTNSPYFDTAKLPEEYGQQLFYWYFPESGSKCASGALISRTPSNIAGNRYTRPGELGYPWEDFELKFGRILFSKTAFESNTGDMVDLSDELIYSSRGGVGCGNYVGPEALSVRETAVVADVVRLSPNPASDLITITAPEKVSQLVITDIVGQTIFKGNYHTDKVQVDISRFAPGMYIAKINGLESVKFVKQ